MLKLDVIGHLGADVELHNENGMNFASMRVAHSQSYKDKDGNVVQSTQWVDVTLRADSKVIPYLKKGTLVYVRGDVRLRAYSSEKDRCWKAGATILCDTIQLLSSQNESKGSNLQKEVNDGNVF